MGVHTGALRRLSQELFVRNKEQVALEAVIAAASATTQTVVLPFPVGGATGSVVWLETLLDFDDLVPGPSIRRLRDSLYHIADRDVYRPLQYCDMNFSNGAHHGDIAWRTRDIVEMSALHLEALVKRVGRMGRLPLGSALRDEVVRRRVDANTYGRLQRFTRAYNAAKHDMDHPAGTHLFSVEDALRAYAISRRLAVPLYPLASLATDPRDYDA